MRPILASLAALLLAASPVAAEPVTLTIVHVNDFDSMAGTAGGAAGGAARLAALVAEVRARGGPVLVTHGGDAISPSLLASFDRGAHMIDLLNRVGIDAMALGNHEFDFGPEVARERIAEAAFPVLSSNAVEPDGSLVEGVTQHLMVEAGRFRVGVFGLTTASTAFKSSPGDVTFRDPVAVAAEEAAALRAAGAHLVVALAHADHAEDRALYAAGDADIILSGDDHDLRVQYEGGPLLVESGSQAEYVTILTVTMDEAEGRSGPEFVWRPAFEIVNTAGMAGDPAVAEVVQGYEDRLSAELDVAVGTTATALDSRRTAVRAEEAAIGNLIADAMRAATGAEVAITNGGGIRADRTYEAGTVLTRRDILSELPFGNRTVVLEVTGADLAAALEHGVGQVEEGAGRFPQVSGLAFTYDPAKPAGERVQSATVGDAPLDLARSYRLATNDFLARGGDGYTMLAGRPAVIDANAGGLMAAQVMAFIQAAGTVAPAVEGRIVRAP